MGAAEFDDHVPQWAGEPTAAPGTHVPPVQLGAAAGKELADVRPRPRFVHITVIAQDPSVTDDDDRILTTLVRVPAERLREGPRGHRFFVVDYDTTNGAAQTPAKLFSTSTGDKNRGVFVDKFTRPSTADSDYLSNSEFRAQNVYGIAAHTLSLFEFYLGRRVPWAFESHELFLVPAGVLRANAAYDRDRRAVVFGYTQDAGGQPQPTSLYYDVIAHEVTHAVLDGLRPRYVEPALPDEAAFHEALADLVALLSVFQLRDVLRNQLVKASTELGGLKDGRLPAEVLTRKRLLATALYGVAEKLGREHYGGKAVRDYAEQLPAGRWWMDDNAYRMPHNRCRIVVAAVMDALTNMWTGRVEVLIDRSPTMPSLDLDRAVEEGVAAAGCLLGMLIGGLNYLPPVELEFEDVIDAVTFADQVEKPYEPEHRRTLRQSFETYEIVDPETHEIDQSDAREPRLDYLNVNFDALKHDPEEVYRCICNNNDLLRIDLNYPLYVERVRTTTRIAADGLPHEEIFAEYSQFVELTAAELPHIVASHPDENEQAEAIRIPKSLPDDTKVRLRGGGILVFDQFGAVQFHQRKGLAWRNQDISRQSQRLQYLVDTNTFDDQGRVGFSDTLSVRERFELLHTDDHRDEMW